jgi:VIT1/CCC1 family predicted Fe2+/Mn2+ transporter
MELNAMPDDLRKLPGPILEPMDRIAETLFGVIMALTFTCTLGVEIGDDIKVRTMLIAALGCNLAWGIIDAGVYLITRVNIESRKVATLGALRNAADSDSARRILAEALHPALASNVSGEQLDALRGKLQRMPALPERARLTKSDALGALAICLLCFISTFPIALPFLLIDDGRTALRASNAVAVAMLFLCGYAFGYRSGLPPWTTALAMVAFGAAMVGVAIALGG